MLAIAAAFLAWRVPGNAQRAAAARVSELEAHEDFLKLRLARAESAVADAEGQLKTVQEQLATTQRHLDMAERWAGGLSRWGPLCVLYWSTGAAEIGPPVEDSSWWDYENVDELLCQVRGALLAARDLQQVDPSRDAILSREVVSSPILTTPLEGYQWVGLEFSAAIEIRVAGQSVDSEMVLLFFADTAEECTVYLQRADSAWLKAVVSYDAKPLQRWIQKLYDDMGPWD
jgi:hypothetical protein